MKVEPLVSIIIPFYNEEKHLLRAVSSVLNQTYQHVEIILVDDGSFDNSNKIALNICQKNSQCKLIRIQNSGPGNARNNGLQKIKGKYVVFLDADDEYHIDAIQKMYENLVLTDSDLSICMYTMLDSKKRELKTTIWNYSKNLNSDEAIFLLADEKLIPTVWGKLFKSVLTKKCVFPKKMWKEDDVFMLQYLSMSKKVSIINESLININCRSNSLTRQTISIKMIQDISSSYNEQLLLIYKYQNKKLERAVVISQINTFLNLFLIIKIDWNKIKDVQSVLNLFFEEIRLLKAKSSEYRIGLKKRIVLIFLISQKIIGYKTSFFILSLVKGEKEKQLKEVKL